MDFLTTATLGVVLEHSFHQNRLVSLDADCWSTERQVGQAV